MTCVVADVWKQEVAPAVLPCHMAESTSNPSALLRVQSNRGLYKRLQQRGVLLSFFFLYLNNGPVKVMYHNVPR